MKTKQLLLSGLLMLMSTNMAWADNATKAYVSVQQNNEVVTAVGTAAFDLSKFPAVEFIDGNAVMTVGSNQVAVLPMSDGGQLAVEFTGTESNLSMTLTDSYATVYSPFQLQVPTESDVEVYAPTYEEPVLKLNSDTRIAPGSIIPVGTGLILRNNGTINFTFSDDAATDSHESALSGTALTIEKPVESGKAVYTLGYDEETKEHGFFGYTGLNLNPGIAYLFAPTLSTANYVSFLFDKPTPTSVSQLSTTDPQQQSVKYIEDGRVVILKNGLKYNLNGQKVK